MRFDQKYKGLTVTILCIGIKVGFDKKCKELTVMILCIGVKVKFGTKYRGDFNAKLMRYFELHTFHIHLFKRIIR